jgi:hypothetical protein
MSSVASLLLAFAIFGNSLLFWPIYRLLHPQKTRRRQNLYVVFVVSLCFYTGLTGFVFYGIYRIDDFHHLFLLVYAAYILLDIGSWIASLVALGSDENYDH